MNVSSKSKVHDADLGFGKNLHRKDKRSRTNDKISLMLKNSSPVLPDPFRDVNRIVTRGKLQPILLRERLSPNPVMRDKISIRLPEITSDGNLKTCRYLLPALNSPNRISLRSPLSPLEPSPSLQFTEKIHPKSISKKLLNFESSLNSNIDVSFGKSNSVSLFTN